MTTKIWPTNYGYEKANGRYRLRWILGVDYIDLMLLHQQLEDYIGAWKALEEAVGEGKIRSIGVSNFKIGTMQKLLAVAKIKPVVDQVECHPYFQQKRAARIFKKERYTFGSLVPHWARRQKMLGEPVLGEIATAHGKSIVQAILRWHMQVGNIAIPKSTNPAHIQSNLVIFDFYTRKKKWKKSAP